MSKNSSFDDINIKKKLFKRRMIMLEDIFVVYFIYKLLIFLIFKKFLYYY